MMRIGWILLTLLLAARPCATEDERPSPLCERCAKLDHPEQEGRCTACDGVTSSVGYYLCVECAGKRGVCVACGCLTARPDGATIGSHDEAVSLDGGLELPATVYCLFVNQRQLSKYRAVVVLYPGVDSTRQDWGRAACHLANEGFYVYSVDLRGRKDGEPPTGKDLEILLQDFAKVRAKATAAWRSEYPLVLVGAGLGGELALVDAASSEEVRGVALFSPGHDSGGPDLSKALTATAPRPVFLVSSNDDQVSLPLVTSLSEAAGARATLETVPGNRVGAALVAKGKEGTPTANALLAWVSRVSARPARR